jgi:hypothetical protein
MWEALVIVRVVMHIGSYSERIRDGVEGHGLDKSVVMILAKALATALCATKGLFLRITGVLVAPRHVDCTPQGSLA